VEQQGDQTFHHYRNFIGESERLRARKILEIWDGELLALTLENRLTSLTRDSSEFQSAYRLKNIGVSIEEVVDAYFSASNHLWLGYANGHITLIESNNQYQQIFSELDAGAPTDIFGYGDGHALVSYDTGAIFEISKEDRTRNTFNVTAVCQISSTINEVAKGSDGELLIGTGGQGIFIFNRDTGRCRIPNHVGPGSGDLANAIVHDIKLTKSSQTAVIGSDQGLFLCNLKYNSCYAQPRKDSQSFLSDVTSVSVGNSESNAFWIGTYKGLFRLIESPFHLFDKNVHDNFESIIGFAQITDSIMLVASYNGVSLVDISNNDVVSSHNQTDHTSLKMKGIMSVYGTGDELYVGYRNRGFEILQGPALSSENWNKSILQGLKSDSISSFLKTNEGLQLIGTYGRGVAILNAEEASAIHVEVESGEPSGINQILFIFQSRDGTIWLGTEAGLRILDLSIKDLRRVNFSAPKPDLASEPTIWTVGETHNFLWFGSMHDGLFKYRKSSSRSAINPWIEKDSAEMPVLNSAIYSIQSGIGDEIWFSTDRGISRRRPDGTIVHYGEQYGVSSIGFELNSSFKDALNNP